MAKKKKVNLDLNGDGKFDKEDKKIAGRVLATKVGKKKVVKKEVPKKEEVKVEKEVEGRVAVKDISLTYPKGSLVPQEQIDLWINSGIEYEQWF